MSSEKFFMLSFTAQADKTQYITLYISTDYIHLQTHINQLILSILPLLNYGPQWESQLDPQFLQEHAHPSHTPVQPPGMDYAL